MMKKTLFLLMIVSVLLLAACQKAAIVPVTQPEQPAQHSEASIQPPQTEKPAETTTQTQPASTAKTVQISINNFAFTPSSITINEGDTVTWTNDDSSSHTVESADGTIKSPELFQGDTFSFKFTEKGSYPYICGIHRSMQGSVTVE